MCGIVAAVARRNVVPILIEGLRRLEYRGYDSAGVAVINESLERIRSCGRVAELAKLAVARGIAGHIGIGHTRWATHGAPSERNAHPHCDESGRLALVHNGIIENYRVLKQYLESRGVTIESDTDTEVLARLIGHLYEGSLEEAVRKALCEVRGTFGIAAIHADEPDLIVAARRGSPLIVGVGDNEYVVASDAAAIVQHTPRVIYLSDNEMAIVSRDGFHTTTLDAAPVTELGPGRTQVRERHGMIVVHRGNDVSVTLWQCEFLDVIDAVPERRPNDQRSRGVRLTDDGIRLGKQPVPQVYRQSAVRLV